MLSHATAVVKRSRSAQHSRGIVRCPHYPWRLCNSITTVDYVHINACRRLCTLRNSDLGSCNLTAGDLDGVSACLNSAGRAGVTLL